MRSESSWRTGYAFAKASGLLSRSFFGSGRNSFISTDEARSLYRLVFGVAAAESSDATLVLEAQRRLGGRFRSSVNGLLPLPRAAGNGAEIGLMRLEAEAVKETLRSWVRKEPLPADLHFGTSGVKPGNYPDLAAMFKGSRYAWVPAAAAGWGFEQELRADRETFRSMWSLAAGKGGEGLRNLIALETRCANAVWAVRLRKYFSLSPAEIGPLLMDLPGAGVKAEALAAADFRPDERARWAAWRFARFVNEDAPGGAWAIDPVTVERRAGAYLLRRFRAAFHLGGGNPASLYAFVRLMRGESSLVGSIFEAARLGTARAELEAYVLEAGA